jgi:hypothetical protein
MVSPHAAHENELKNEGENEVPFTIYGPMRSREHGAHALLCDCSCCATISCWSQCARSQAAAASSASDASASAAASPGDIAALQRDINELKSQIEAAENGGNEWNDPALVGMRADETALQEKEYLLLRARQTVATSGTF